jgi:hypothetical protein
MKRLPDTPKGWIDYYTALADRADENYQATGETKYRTQRDKYSACVDAFEALQAGEKDRDEIQRELKQKLIDSADAVMARMADTMHTSAEVKRMIMEIIGGAI